MSECGQYVCRRNLWFVNRNNFSKLNENLYTVFKSNWYSEISKKIEAKWMKSRERFNPYLKNVRRRFAMDLSTRAVFREMSCIQHPPSPLSRDALQSSRRSKSGQYLIECKYRFQKFRSMCKSERRDCVTDIRL